MKDPHGIRLDTVGIFYTVSAAMYSTFCTSPKEVLLFLSNFAIRPGHTFFTVWPPRSPILRNEGNIDLSVVLHTKISPFAFFGRKHVGRLLGTAVKTVRM